jgi:putative FmdB family regulatory protein
LPTYEYACTACGHRLDAVQSFSDDPLTECPECRGALRKVYGAVGIVLKGSGFYKTDSRAAAGSNGSNGNGKRTPGESTSDSGSGKDSSGTDSSGSGKESSSKESSSSSKDGSGKKDTKAAASSST